MAALVPEVQQTLMTSVTTLRGQRRSQSSTREIRFRVPHFARRGRDSRTPGSGAPQPINQRTLRDSHFDTPFGLQIGWLKPLTPQSLEVPVAGLVHVDFDPRNPSSDDFLLQQLARIFVY